MHTYQSLLRIFIYSSLITFTCCKPNQTSFSEIEYSKYYLLHLSRGEHVDTLSDAESRQVENPEEDIFKFQILDSVSFTYKSHLYTIKKLSNYQNAPTDGAHLAYSEKSLGIFYWKSLTWRNFIMLRTDNDSVNQFIDVLLGNIILDPRLSDLPWENQSNQFEKPSVLDTIKTK